MQQGKKSTLMKIRIKAFATIKEICGFNETEMEFPEGTTIKDVVDSLPGQEKIQEIRQSLLFAINETYSTDDNQLSHDDVIAIFPPVSGG